MCNASRCRFDGIFRAAFDSILFRLETRSHSVLPTALVNLLVEVRFEFTAGKGAFVIVPFKDFKFIKNLIPK